MIILKKSLNSWVANLKNKLSEIGLRDFWLNQDNIRVNLHFPVRIIDIFVQSNFEQITVRPNVRYIQYMHVIDHFILQYYLTKAIPIKYKKQICRKRMSSHN